MSIGDSLRCGGAAVGLLVLASCAGLEQRALEPTDRTAVVKATTWGKVYRGGYVEIASVNGVEPSWRLRSEMELAAGPQTAMFYVYLCNGGMRDCISITQAQISFRAEPRHTYRVRAREQLNGSNRFWVWVEDEADGKAVGGTQPPASAEAGSTGFAPTLRQSTETIGKHAAVECRSRDVHLQPLRFWRTDKSPVFGAFVFAGDRGSMALS